MVLTEPFHFTITMADNEEIKAGGEEEEQDQELHQI